MHENWQGNPLWDFMKDRSLSPCQFAILAKTDFTTSYKVLNAELQRLPRRVVEAVDQLEGAGAGNKLSNAYELYRDRLAHALLMKA